MSLRVIPATDKSHDLAAGSFGWTTFWTQVTEPMGFYLLDLCFPIFLALFRLFILQLGLCSRTTALREATNDHNPLIGVSLDADLIADPDDPSRFDASAVDMDSTPCDSFGR